MAAATAVFARMRWAAFSSFMLAIVAMEQYPGGTFLDSTTPGYSISQNFLSDLGMTVSHSGRPNALGAVCFVTALCVLALGFAGAMIGFVGLYGTPASRPFARAAALVGLLVATAFAGVAVTPENAVLHLHVQLTLLAFRLFPAVPLLFIVASLRDAGVPSTITAAWVTLFVVLTLYVGVLQWGPPALTLEGLVVQVAAQKIVAIMAVSVLLYQCSLAEKTM